MRYSMALAVATGADLTQATQFLGLALMKTNQDMSVAAKYIDMFAGVVATSGMGLGNLQKAIITLAPVINQTGASMEFFTGTLAHLYRGGLYGIAAGRGLEQVFNQLAAPSQSTADVMTRLGVSVWTATGEMRPLNDVLMDLVTGINASDNAYQSFSAVMDTFSTVYARQVFDALVTQTDAWQNNIAAMYTAGDAFDGVGQAFGMAETTGRGLTVSLQRVRAAFSDILITIWDLKSEDTITFWDSIGDAVERLALLFREGGSLHAGLVFIVNAFVAAFDLLISVITRTISGVQYVVSVLSFQSLTDSAAYFGQALYGVLVHIANAITALVRFIGIPILQFVIDVSSAIRDKFMDALVRVADIVAVASTALTNMGDNTASVTNVFQALGELLVAVATGLFRVSAILADFFVPLMLEATSTLTGIGNAGNYARNIFTWFGETLRSIANLVTTVVVAITRLVTAAITPLTSSLGTATGGGYLFAVSLLGVLYIIPKFINGLATVIDVASRLLAPVLQLVVYLLYQLARVVLWVFTSAIIPLAKYVLSLVTAFDTLSPVLQGIGIGLAFLFAQLTLLAIFKTVTKYVGGFHEALTGAKAATAALGNATTALSALQAKHAAASAKVVASQTALAAAQAKLNTAQAAEAAASVALASARKKTLALKSSLNVATNARIKAEAALTSATKVATKAEAARTKTALALSAAQAKVSAAQAAQVASTKTWTLLLNKLTLAFSKLNIAMLASPIGLKMLGISALVGAIAAVVLWVNAQEDAQARLTKELRSATDAQRDFVTRSRDATEALRDNIHETTRNADETRQLADSVYRLAGLADRTAGQYAQLRNEISRLNTTIPGLNLAFDETHNVLNHSAEALQVFLDLAELSAQTPLFTDEQNRLAREQYDILERLSNATALLSEAERQLAEDLTDSSIVRNRLNTNLANAQALVDTYNRMLSTNTSMQQNNSLALSRHYDRLGEVQRLYEGLAREIALYTELTDLQGRELTALTSAFTEHYKVVSGVFDEFSTMYEKSLDDFINYLAGTAASIEQHTANMLRFEYLMDALAKMAADGRIHEGFVEQIQRMELDGLPLLESVVNASADQLDALNEVYARNLANLATNAQTQVAIFGEAVDEMIEATATALRETQEVNTAMRDMIESGISELRLPVQNGTIADIGASVGEGFAGGIKSGERAVWYQANSLSELVRTVFRRNLDIRNPSMVAHAYGRSVSNGFARGIDDGSGNVLLVVQQLAHDISQPLVRVNLQSYGRSIMTGLSDGLRQGKQGVQATVLETCNLITRTFTNFFDIVNPSRKMRAEIGTPITEGIALGISDGKRRVVETAQEVSRAIYTEMVAWVAEYEVTTATFHLTELDKWRAFVEEYRGVQAAKTDADREAARERERIAQEEVRLFGLWLDARLEYTADNLEAEVQLLQSILREVDANADYRITVEERLRDRQRTLLNETYRAQKDVMERMLALEDEYIRALDDRTAALVRTFDMFRELNLMETNVDANRIKVEELTEAYDAARARLVETRTEMRNAEQGTDQWIRAQQRNVTAQREVETAHENLTRAVSNAARSQTSIMIDNTRDQLHNMEEWLREVDRLTRTGVYEGFVAHMRNMGPLAINYLRELNNGSAAELNMLAELYREKHALARHAATTELQGLRDDTTRQIRDLANELSVLGITEFWQTGHSMVGGIKMGLQQNAWQITEAVRAMMQDAINVANAAIRANSPSKEGMDIGERFVVGIAEGIYKGAKLIKDAVESLTDYMTGFIPPDVSSWYRELDKLSRLTIPLNNVQLELDKKLSYSSAARAPRTQPTESSREITVNLYGQIDMSSDVDAENWGRKLGQALHREERRQGVVLI
jgi:TP901 family phage tail tape measure protein